MERPTVLSGPLMPRATSMVVRPFYARTMRLMSAGRCIRVVWNAARDSAAGRRKFAVPTIANGRVYVGTATELDVYGLLGVFCADVHPHLAPSTNPCTSRLPTRLRVRRFMTRRMALYPRRPLWSIRARSRSATPGPSGRWPSHPDILPVRSPRRPTPSAASRLRPASGLIRWLCLVSRLVLWAPKRQQRRAALDRWQSLEGGCGVVCNAGERTELHH